MINREEISRFCCLATVVGRAVYEIELMQFVLSEKKKSR
jgi:hypothetical protein